MWAFDKDWCQFADQIGEHDPAPIKITRNEFIGLENWCSVTQVSADMSEVVLDMSCNGEGITSADRIYLQVEGDSLKIRRAGEEADVVSSLCKMTASWPPPKMPLIKLTCIQGFNALEDV